MEGVAAGSSAADVGGASEVDEADSAAPTASDVQTWRGLLEATGRVVVDCPVPDGWSNGMASVALDQPLPDGRTYLPGVVGEGRVAIGVPGGGAGGGTVTLPGHGSARLVWFETSAGAVDCRAAGTHAPSGTLHIVAVHDGTLEPTDYIGLACGEPFFFEPNGEAVVSVPVGACEVGVAPVASVDDGMIALTPVVVEVQEGAVRIVELELDPE